MSPGHKTIAESFDSQPELYGPCVALRPLREGDRSALYSVAADPLLWAQHPSNRHRQAEFDTFFDQSLASGGALLVTDTATAAVIGSSRYHGYNPQNNSVEIGWTFLARACWGGKYNRELKTLMLRHAFESVETVIFYIDANNQRSQKAIEKIGALRDAQTDAKGRVVYRLARPDFRSPD